MHKSKVSSLSFLFFAACQDVKEKKQRFLKAAKTEHEAISKINAMTT
jgi:hypothetical protein